MNSGQWSVNRVHARREKLRRHLAITQLVHGDRVYLFDPALEADLYIDLIGEDYSLRACGFDGIWGEGKSLIDALKDLSAGFDYAFRTVAATADENLDAAELDLKRLLLGASPWRPDKFSVFSRPETNTQARDQCPIEISITPSTPRTRPAASLPSSGRTSRKPTPRPAPAATRASKPSSRAAAPLGLATLAAQQFGEMAKTVDDDLIGIATHTKTWGDLTDDALSKLPVFGQFYSAAKELVDVFDDIGASVAKAFGLDGLAGWLESDKEKLAEIAAAQKKTADYQKAVATESESKKKIDDELKKVRLRPAANLTSNATKTTPPSRTRNPKSKRKKMRPKPKATARTM